MKKIPFKKKYILLYCAILIALVTGVAFFIRNLAKPSVGTVSDLSSQTDPDISVALGDLNGAYFNTKFPGRYQLQPNPNPSASLESWILIAHQYAADAIAGKIAISVTKLPAGGVKEDSAYKEYESLPATYKLTNVTYGGAAVVLATRSDSSFERTALWAHANYLATFTITAGQRSDQLITDLDVLLNNLTWK